MTYKLMVYKRASSIKVLSLEELQARLCSGGGRQEGTEDPTADPDGEEEAGEEQAEAEAMAAEATSQREQGCPHEEA